MNDAAVILSARPLSRRAEVDEHFLFNTLHSVSALTMADPAGARSLCLMLADFLRQSLALGAEGRVTLARDLALAETYLAIERIRYGARLRTEIDADGAHECLVPPLLLQPLVENAVKHGVAHMLDGGTVRVAASRSGARLSLRVESPRDPDRLHPADAASALADVRARLRALYGRKATMATGAARDRCCVEIGMPAVSL